MSVLFQEAVEAVAKLSVEEQRALAQFLLPDNPAIDATWDSLLEASQGMLKRLGEEALAEHRAGLTEPLDLDNL